MATYKVLQDIEAEDKLLGPLTLKQFIFAVLALACGYVSFLLLTAGLGFLVLLFLPPMLVFGFLAWPWGREQPTEIWLLAKLRFLVKPRKRIWDQSGIKDLVTVTAPVLEEKNYTDGLSQGEVRSRLQALASTIDSRGWAIKNVNVNLFQQPAYATDGSDRLVGLSNLPQEVVGGDISAADDILDERNNPTAQNLDRMINASSTAHRQQLVEQMKQSAAAPAAGAQQQPADYWFLNQTSGQIPAGQAVFDGAVTVRPEDPSALPQASAPAGNDDPAIAAQLQAAQNKTLAAYGHMRTIDPLGAPQASQPAAAPPVDKPAAKPSGKTPDAAILELASNDDLDVATIARQANKKVSDLGDGEVVVPLR